jgi:hypothetical protein
LDSRGEREREGVGRRGRGRKSRERERDTEGEEERDKSWRKEERKTRRVREKRVVIEGVRGRKSRGRERKSEGGLYRFLLDLLREGLQYYVALWVGLDVVEQVNHDQEKAFFLQDFCIVTAFSLKCPIREKSVAAASSELRYR